MDLAARLGTRVQILQVRGLSGRLIGIRQPFNLTDAEQKQLVTFLKALTDPRARDLSALFPASVPSGLPVR